MTIKEFITSRIQLFFFLVTMILMAQILLGNAIEPDRVLYYKDFIGTFKMAGLCIIPTFVTYSKKELTLKQMLFRHVIQFALIEGVMIALAISGIENSPQKVSSIVSICVAVAVIYALAISVMWFRQNLESKKLTKLLKNIQNN